MGAKISTQAIILENFISFKRKFAARDVCGLTSPYIREEAGGEPGREQQLARGGEERRERSSRGRRRRRRRWRRRRRLGQKREQQ